MRKGQKYTRWAKGLGFALIFISILLIGIFLLRGELIITNSDPNIETSSSISCESNNVIYPIFNIPNSTGSNMVINLIFNNNQLNSISLIYKIYYSDENTAMTSNSRIHAKMNESFSAELDADALNANYTTVGNITRLSLYANETDLDQFSQKYFMINGTLATLDDYKNNYENQGFICVLRNEENN